ncbi:TIM barrel protein [Anaerobium acetethylicum]|uniref:Sugar phosphate isomerase/epimerase n=1 Tax=Anaerobium acetethylicum TaxID=1619234 RepID=A0A1D3TWL9_9FIRM|nr:TIM barrel protein [Anaerobium acetethylicum]SCP98615.1 Sugar phosphate isomerase/epimerase [Anaerobium acetethylicum]
MEKIKIGAVAWGLPGAGYYAPRIARAAGLDGIQLELGSYEMGYPLAQELVRKSYIEEGEKYNIAYPAIVLNDVMEHEFINGKDTKNTKIALEQIEIAVETADKMNIRKIMIPNFLKNLITEEQHVENTIETLQFACGVAKKKGIDILTENALDWRRQREVMEKVGHSNLKVHFDTQNFKYNFDMDQCEQLENLFDLMDNQLHTKDGIQFPGGKLLGEGNTLFYDQMKFLKEHHFEGWIIIENYYNMYPLRNDMIAQAQNLITDIQTIKKCFLN